MPTTRPGRHAGGQVDGDRARAAADVEQVEPGAQRGQQVAGGVLGGAPAVRLQHRLGVAVGVGVHARILPRHHQWNIVSVKQVVCIWTGAHTPGQTRRGRDP